MLDGDTVSAYDAHGIYGFPRQRSVYWGPVDGGDDGDVWERSAPVGSDMAPGDFATEISGLAAGTNYYVRFMAVNESGESWSEPVYFITGEVWLEKVSDATEIGLVPGTAVVHRVAGAVAEPLIVNYSVSGTATPGADYAALSGKVVIPAGATNAVIEVVPIFDHLIEGTETVELTLLPALCNRGRNQRRWRLGSGQLSRLGGTVSALACARNWPRCRCRVTEWCSMLPQPTRR